MQAVQLDQYTQVAVREPTQQTGLLHSRRVSKCTCRCSRRTICELVVITLCLGGIIGGLLIARYSR